MGGKEAPADDEHNADSPGILRGREDIHGQGGAVLSPIDHVLLAIGCGFVGFDERRAECDKRTHDKHHPGQGSIHHRNSWSSKLLGYKLLVVSLNLYRLRLTWVIGMAEPRSDHQDGVIPV